MITFTNFISEETEKNKAVISDFLQKIYSCGTLVGINELEKYYNRRKTEVTISDTDDIQIRDSIAKKKQEIEDLENEKGA